MARRPYQVKREQLTDRQWADMGDLFAVLHDIAARVSARKAAAK